MIQNKNENLNFSHQDALEEAIRELDIQIQEERARSISRDTKALDQCRNLLCNDQGNINAVGCKCRQSRNLNYTTQQFEDQVQIEFKMDCEANNYFEEDYESIIEVRPMWLQKELSESKNFYSKSCASEEHSNLNNKSNRHIMHPEIEGNKIIYCEEFSESQIIDISSDSIDCDNNKFFGCKRQKVEENKQCNMENGLNQSLDDISIQNELLINGNSVSTSNDHACTPMTEVKTKQSRISAAVCCESFTHTIECNQKEKLQNRKKKRIIKSDRKNHQDGPSKSTRKYTCKPEGSSIRKRTKLRSSGESSSVHAIDLSKRRDVINKTILRVLRRHLTQEFKKLVPQQYEDKNEIIEKFYENIEIYSTKIFGEFNPDLKVLQFYLATVIDHRSIKENDIKKMSMSTEDLTIFYDCLYKYSHTRLVNLFGVKPLGVIFEYFYNSAKEDVLKNEAAMAKNKTLYSKVLEEFLFIFQGKIDIASMID